MAMGARLCSSSIIVVVVVLIVATAAEAMRCPGTTSVYRRPKKKAADMVDMPLDADVFAEPAGRNAPQQVHITLGDPDGDGHDGVVGDHGGGRQQHRLVRPRPWTSSTWPPTPPSPPTRTTITPPASSTTAPHY
ncbi:hypothetical protein OsJ_37005 [Oryza sativa Japonica Group]|uniref:Uncharacterized protein n=1 Tax=Oryza sativa subsp. japonica TaxID=39947 RepID=A3CJT5_ORYSJ|nr:hypothetical protein OsJ_37005 [Oryza sativa Japonica Group]